MSLILDALKKLEREKQAPDRGFLVVAHVPWAAGSSGRGKWIALIAGLALAVVTAAVFAVVISRRPTLPATAAVVAPVSTVAPASVVPAGAPAAPTTYAAPIPPARSAIAPLAVPPPAAPLRSRSPEARTPSASDEPPPPEEDAPIAPVSEAATPSAHKPVAPAQADLRLNAISQQDGRPVAILNDRLVREGDVFDGVRVVRIGEDEVEVEIAGKRRIVRF